MSDYKLSLCVQLADKVISDEGYHGYRCGYEQGCYCGLQERYEQLTDIFYDIIESVEEDDLAAFQTAVIKKFEADEEWSRCVPIIKKFNLTFNPAEKGSGEF